MGAMWVSVLEEGVPEAAASELSDGDRLEQPQLVVTWRKAPASI